MLIFILYLGLDCIYFDGNLNKLSHIKNLAK